MVDLQAPAVGMTGFQRQAIHELHDDLALEPNSVAGQCKSKDVRWLQFVGDTGTQLLRGITRHDENFAMFVFELQLDCGTFTNKRWGEGDDRNHPECGGALSLWVDPNDRDPAPDNV